ncbi:MAG: PA2169 family four-helix-bundle protein, partial [Bacteroidota bacterium]
CLSGWHGFSNPEECKSYLYKLKNDGMENNEKTAEILNDLIEINHDRVNGYTKAAKETAAEDADLRSLFMEMADDSRLYAVELKKFVQRTGEAPAEGTTVRGKIYRVWMDIKAAVSGQSRKAILASCEFGEDAAQKAYNAALEEEELSPRIREVITDQQSELKRAHDRIKRMRDIQSA